MKWSKDIVREHLILIKQKDGVIYNNHIRKNYDKLRGAINRHFDSYSEAIAYAGFDPKQEKGPIGTSFRGKHHSEETKKYLSSLNKGKFSGEKNPMFGKRHSEKISRKTKNWIKLNPDHQTGNKNPMFGKQQSAESNKKRSESLKIYNSQFEKRPYNLTKLGRKRLQISRSKNIARQKTSNTDIEQKIEYLLKELNVNYKLQFQFKYFVVDFFLPKYNLVIWCDGDYWHGNPSFYPVLTKRQKNQHRLDRSHESYLSKRNINYIRLWGFDIKNNFNLCKKQIELLINGDN